MHFLRGMLEYTGDSVSCGRFGRHAYAHQLSAHMCCKSRQTNFKGSSTLEKMQEPSPEVATRRNSLII